MREAELSRYVDVVCELGGRIDSDMDMFKDVEENGSFLSRIAIILTASARTVSVCRDADRSWWLYDSHGTHAESGRSCVLRFETLDDMLRVLSLSIVSHEEDGVVQSTSEMTRQTNQCFSLCVMCKRAESNGYKSHRNDDLIF